MPSVPQIIAMRDRRQRPARVRTGFRAGLLTSLFISLLLVSGLIAPVLVYADISQDLPSLETLSVQLEPPHGLLLQPTRLYDRSGEHLLLTIEHPAAAGRQYLSLPAEGGESSSPDLRPAGETFPPELVSATIAAADPEFWTHPGFFIDGLFEGEHPTIAQKLVSALLLNSEPPGLRTAMRERLLAWQVTERFGKEKVLEWYLNSAQYGDLVYGADAAARVYFAKPAAQLSLEEAAFLAAVADRRDLQGSHMRAQAVLRQKEILSHMADQGLVKREAARQAAGEKLVFRPPESREYDPYAAFTSLAVRQLETQASRARFERGGMTVFTTLDFDLQTEVNCTVAVYLDRLRAPQSESTLDPSGCQAARLLPTLPILKSQAENENDLNPGSPEEVGADVVVLDAQTGQILALVSQSDATGGGEQLEHLPGQTSLPTHEPGSLVTPFIYLTAFTQTMNPSSLLWDTPDGLPHADIQNFDGLFHGPVRLRVALANDYLAPAAKVLAQVGPENVESTAHQLGLVSLDFSNPDPSLSDGNLSVLEASRPFTIFANQGIFAGQSTQGAADILQTPALQRVTGPDGQVWLDWMEAQNQSVLSPQLAYLTTHVLSDEAARWASLGHPNPLEIGRPAGAKMGQTIAGNDTWTVGYTPQLVVGVWVGREAVETQLAEDRTSAGAAERETAEDAEPRTRMPANAASALWHAMMQYASRDRSPEDWNAPPGISTLEVCDPSGLLPTSNCPAVVSEVFLDGSQPIQRDNLYHSVQINRETGRLATLFTPAELVDERVFMLFPEEAEEWARTAGVPVPPEDYDPVPPQQISSDARIDSPAMFSYVGGLVSIQGTAAGEGFDFYRVQVGQGLNPHEWIQIGEDNSQPVQEGILAEWDTQELDGLYAVQLLVVREDRSVETTLIQVSVDNQPPDVSAFYPEDGQTISPTADNLITLQARAVDDLAVGQVEFYIDDRLVETLTQPPFATAWRSRPGKHILRLVAVDRAGNQDEATIEFTVD